MRKLFVLIGTTVGSGVGWWLGTYIGTLTALTLSMFGFGIGMWYGARLARRYE